MFTNTIHQPSAVLGTALQTDNARIVSQIHRFLSRITLHQVDVRTTFYCVYQFRNTHSLRPAGVAKHSFYQNVWRHSRELEFSWYGVTIEVMNISLTGFGSVNYPLTALWLVIWILSQRLRKLRKIYSPASLYINSELAAKRLLLYLVTGSLTCLSILPTCCFSFADFNWSKWFLIFVFLSICVCLMRLK